MPNNIALLTGVRFLHDLATAVWIGGLMAMGLAVLPALRKGLGPGPQARALMLGIQKRLRVLVFASVAVLVVTGLLLSRRSLQFQGLFSWGNPYTAVLAWKHLLVIAMVVIAAVRGVALGRPAAQAAGAAPATAGPGANRAPGARDRLAMLLLLVNLVLGVGVILLSALSAVIARGGAR